MFKAIALLVDAKKGMSALQLQRDLGVNYRTAWYLNHRIREVMVDTDAPKLRGVVEIDETYIGGKQRGHKGKRKNKDVVIGMRERGGEVRLVHTKDASAQSLWEVANKHMWSDAQAIMTDENPGYNFSLSRLRNVRQARIKHKERVYVRGDVHTNTVESAFSLLKRGVIVLDLVNQELYDQRLV